MKTRFKIVFATLLSCAVGSVWANTWSGGNWSETLADGQDLVVTLTGDTTLTLESAVTAASLTVEGTGKLTLDGARLSVTGAFAANADVEATTSSLLIDTGTTVVAEGATVTYTRLEKVAVSGIGGKGTFVRKGTGDMDVINSVGGTAIGGGVTMRLEAGHTIFATGDRGDAQLGDSKIVLADGAWLDDYGWFKVTGTCEVVYDGTAEREIFYGCGYYNKTVQGSGKFVFSGTGPLQFCSYYKATGGLTVDGTLRLRFNDNSISSLDGKGTLVLADGTRTLASAGYLAHEIGFNGEITDYGLATHLSLYQTTTDASRYVATAAGKAAQIVEVSPYTAAYCDNCNLGSGDFTVMVRAKTEAVDKSVLLALGTRANGAIGFRSNADGQVQFASWASSALSTCSSYANVATPTKRYHVYALVYDSTEKTMSFYADATLVQTVDFTFTNYGGQFQLGAIYNGTSDSDSVKSTNVFMDDFRVYHAAVSPADQGAMLTVWPAPAYSAAVSADTAFGSIAWNEGSYAVMDDTAVSLALEDGAVVTAGDSYVAPASLAASGAGTLTLVAGTEGTLAVGEGVTLKLVVSDLQIASGYTASGVTLKKEGASIVFVDSNGTVVANTSSGTELAPTACTWTNAAGDSSWSNSENWSPSVPGENANVVLRVVADTALEVPSTLALKTLVVEGSGTLTLSGAKLTVSSGLAVKANLETSRETLGFSSATIESGCVFGYDTGSDTLSQQGSITGAGTLRKTGGGTFKLSSPNSSTRILDGGVTVDIEKGTFFLDGSNAIDPAIGTATFVLGEDDTTGLDNYGWFSVAGTLTISNETDKTVLNNATYQNRSALTGAGSVVKGGAGVLTFATYLNQAATPVTVRDGTFLLYAAKGVNWSYAGTVSGSGRIGKTGPGTVTVTTGMTYANGLVCDEGTLLLAKTSYTYGISGTGTLMLGTEPIYLGRGSDGNSIKDATVASTNASAVVHLGGYVSGFYCDGGQVANGTFALNGGSLNAYGWPNIAAGSSMTISNDVAATYSGNNTANTLQCLSGSTGAFVKKGTGLLTLTVNLDVTDIDIQGGRLTLSADNTFKQNRAAATTVTGDGWLDYDHVMNVATTALSVHNLSLREGAGFSGSDFTVTGVLKPLATLDSLAKTFTMADGSAISVADLAAPAFADGLSTFNVAAGSTVGVQVGSRTDCAGDVGVATYLFKYAARPEGAFVLSGANIGHWKAGKVADGVRTMAPGFTLIVR